MTDLRSAVRRAVTTPTVRPNPYARKNYAGHIAAVVFFVAAIAQFLDKPIEIPEEVVAVEPEIRHVPEPIEATAYLPLDAFCLSLNIFFEARDQSIAGQVAVAQVTMNRVRSEKYPETVCGVVYQYKQFSWYWDGKSDVPTEEEAWERAQMVAQGVLAGSGHAALMGDVLHYHAWYVNPRWNKRMTVSMRIGDHIFYGGSE